MGEVTIRRAVIEDLPAAIAMLVEVDDLHRKALPWLFRQLDEPRLAGFLEDYVSKRDHTMLLATTSEGALAGVLYMFMRQPARAPIVKPTRGDKIYFVTKRINTGSESGTAMQTENGSILDQTITTIGTILGPELDQIMLSVYEFNETARAFWASVGFQTLSHRLVAHCKPGVGA